jgi:hypothetical protein
MNYRQPPEDETVRGHGVKNPRQGKHCTQETSGKSKQSPYGDNPTDKRPANLVEGERKWSTGVLQVVRDHQRDDRGDATIGL